MVIWIGQDGQGKDSTGRERVFKMITSVRNGAAGTGLVWHGAERIGKDWVFKVIANTPMARPCGVRRGPAR